MMTAIKIFNLLPLLYVTKIFELLYNVIKK
jgi:hypothetical protein